MCDPREAAEQGAGPGAARQVHPHLSVGVEQQWKPLARPQSGPADIQVGAQSGQRLYSV